VSDVVGFFFRVTCVDCWLVSGTGCGLLGVTDDSGGAEASQLVDAVMDTARILRHLVPGQESIPELSFPFPSPCSVSADAGSPVDFNNRKPPLPSGILREVTRRFNLWRHGHLHRTMTIGVRCVVELAWHARWMGGCAGAGSWSGFLLVSVLCASMRCPMDRCCTCSRRVSMADFVWVLRGLAFQGKPLELDTSPASCATFGLSPGALLHTAQVRERLLRS